jgi:hypothetical protein
MPLLKELKQVIGDLVILSFVRISRLKWIGHVNRMENKRTVIRILKEVDQETDGGIVYKQTLRSVKLTTGKKGQKTELTGKGPLRRRRSALDRSATEEEGDSVDETAFLLSVALYSPNTVQKISSSGRLFMYLYFFLYLFLSPTFFL